MTSSLVSLTVAGRRVDDAVAVFVAYAERHAGTVVRYDLAELGDPMVLTLAEVTRTRVIASRISNAEAQWFIETARDAPWATVPVDAQLKDADPSVDVGLYAFANALYDHFYGQRPRGVSVAKISKVLHLKRPGMVPILDSHLLGTYRYQASAAAQRYLTDWKPGRRLYWAAIRDDLVEPNNADALSTGRRLLGAHDREEVRRLSELTDLRLLDIVTWTP